MFHFFERFYYLQVLKTTENAEDTEKYFKSNDTYLTIINRIKPMSENPGQQAIQYFHQAQSHLDRGQYKDAQAIRHISWQAGYSLLMAKKRYLEEIQEYS